MAQFGTNEAQSNETILESKFGREGYHVSETRDIFVYILGRDETQIVKLTAQIRHNCMRSFP